MHTPPASQTICAQQTLLYNYEYMRPHTHTPWHPHAFCCYAHDVLCTLEDPFLHVPLPHP